MNYLSQLETFLTLGGKLNTRSNALRHARRIWPTLHPNARRASVNWFLAQPVERIAKIRASL